MRNDKIYCMASANYILHFGNEKRTVCIIMTTLKKKSLECEKASACDGYMEIVARKKGTLSKL